MMQLWSDEDGVRRFYLLREGSVIIGRHPSCQIVVSGGKVSKKHLQCHVEGGVVTIRDLGSSNGTFVNGSPVTTCVLNHGDEVSLGGYRLFFDTQGVPADAQVAPTAPVDQGPPAPGAPAETVQTAEAQAPPSEPRQPGIPFQEEPDGDETPADGTFVPQAYDPQSLQPQVVARDGHMYLRDPRTNREVEIVPRGAGAPADLSGHYAEQAAADKKKNTYLIGGAIAVAVLMILFLALSSSTTDQEPVTQKKAFPRSKYNELANGSVDQMTAGKFKEAVKNLRTAHKEYPTYQVASTLLDIAEKWQKSGKGRDEFNWLAVESSLRELRDSRWATVKVRNFASDRIEWIYNIQHHQDIVAKGVKLLAADDPEQALAEFRKLPKDSLVYKKQRQQIAATVAACYDKRMRLAKDALDGENWADAIQEYKAAERYASELEKTDVASGIRVARKRMREERLLNSANARLREDTVSSLKAASTLLAGVEDGGPLGPRKTELAERIRRRLAELEGEEQAQIAQAHYTAGRGVEAIRIITQKQLTALYPLRTRIEKIMSLLKEAKAALKNGDYDLARQKAAEVANEEASSRNAYHRTALDTLSDLTRRAKDIAAEYNKRADAALQKDDPQTARKLYLTAMRWDPHRTIGKDGLADLRHLAEITYNRARDLRNQGHKEEAIQLFEKVLLYVEEGSKYHKWAKRQLSELRTEPPEKPDDLP